MSALSSRTTCVYQKLPRENFSRRHARRSLTAKVSAIQRAIGRLRAAFRVFFDDLLEHVPVEAQVRDKALKGGVLLFQLL
jgi:hypothetical protein